MNIPMSIQQHDSITLDPITDDPITHDPKARFRRRSIALAIVAGLMWAACARAGALECPLYPSTWTPGYAIGTLTLQDFSYAGYHRGDIALPAMPPGAVFDATSYGADRTGTADATVAIQTALDAAGAAGGGVVYLPAGTYRIKPQGTTSYALWIRSNNVALRGAGVGRTFLYDTATVLRGKAVIRVQPATGGGWSSPTGTSIPLREDARAGKKTILPASTTGLSGAWVVVRSDVTTDFIAEHGMTGWWSTAIEGPTYYRKVISVDAASGSVVLDAPIRQVMKVRDGARVYPVNEPLREVAIEDLSIGNAQSTKTSGWGDNDFDIAGTGAYDVSTSSLVSFRFVRDCWMRRVQTYRPAGNASDVRMLSNGVRLREARGVTIQDCDFSKPQYRGENGNGYGYAIEGNENLLLRCSATGDRHSFSFKSMGTGGNVLEACASHAPRLGCDFHMWLSAANLIDGMMFDDDYFDAEVRPFPPTATIDLHGMTTTDSVFWRSISTTTTTPRWPCLIKSLQYGNGYVIGTQGTTTSVITMPTIDDTKETAPEDYTFAIGMGATLTPASLRDDQLAKRLGVRPAVSLTSPAAGTSFYAPARPTVLASATDADGTIRSVEFLLDGSSVSVNTSAPYSCVLPSLAAGSYLVTAIATDNSGLQTTSSALTITVLPPASTDVVWFDDAAPAGALLSSDGGDAWTGWVSTSPTPFSGTMSIRSSISAGEHQLYFTGALASLPVASGERLFAYIFLDPAAPPQEIMLQWNDGSWEHRAYWGTNAIGWGVDGTNARRYMAALPATGVWTRLDVPASILGLENRTITGMAFTLYGGRATWDRAGKASALVATSSLRAAEATDGSALLAEAPALDGARASESGKPGCGQGGIVGALTLLTLVMRRVVMIRCKP